MSWRSPADGQAVSGPALRGSRHAASPLREPGYT
ncbi:unnamed protein product [Mycetohabitans rhizoxinica HKI 454]|uniref:Uncharacterized protein n=1 Tax=Mycetohabitans rhizoxinica (strain DSM 19002 / CIP 109453 / HKI 454) TaxID=882378 RepID=E5ALE6_MYCRK|nr:unnamed protein product [Mycetohabitans rhizoxinica HKI 454]